MKYGAWIGGRMLAQCWILWLTKLVMYTFPFWVRCGSGPFLSVLCRGPFSILCSPD